MKTQIKHIVALLAAVLAPFAVQAQEFSADQITRDSSSKIIRGRVYRSATMIRAEAAPSNAADPQFLLIVDIAKQTSYSIISNRKSIMVAHGRAALNKASIALPINENPCTPINGGLPPADTSCKKLGEEAVKAVRR